MKSSKGVCLGLSIFFCFVILSGCCDVYQWPWCPPPEEPVPEEPTEPPIFTFTPAPITRLCPAWVGGDKDFKGHGPNVTASASLQIKNSNKEVWVNLYLHAKETRSDWTEARGTWSRYLWPIPSGYSIVNIVSDQSSNASYTDTNHDLDRPAVQGGSLVYKFEIMGDTWGNDVGNCTTGDVYMNVYFNPVKVRGKEIE